MLCLKAITYLKRKVKKFRESKQGQPTKPVNDMEVEEEDSDSDSCKSFDENDEEWNQERDEDEFEDSKGEFVNEEEIDSDKKMTMKKYPMKLSYSIGEI